MIEIFKTNVIKKEDADCLTNQLFEIFPNAAINFDLEDCDCILRVENDEREFDTKEIIMCVKREGFHCEVLND